MFELFLSGAFRLEESRSRSKLVLECSAGKADVIILTPQALGISCELVVRQTFRLPQSLVVPSLQEKDVRTRIRGLEFLLVRHWNRFESFERLLCDIEIPLLRDSQPRLHPQKLHRIRI